MEIIKPDMSSIWASGGAKITPSMAKISTGWTAEIPPHQWENWVQGRQDQALAYLFQRGVAEWDPNTEYWAGKSVTIRDGVLWVAATNNVGSEPSEINPDWYSTVTPNASSTNRGVVELATTPETATGTDPERVVTPLGLKQGSLSRYTTNGSYRLPNSFGSLLFNWGTISSSTADVVFDTPYQSQVFSVVSSEGNAPASQGFTVFMSYNITTTGFSARIRDQTGANATGTQSQRWFAIGI